jgi:SAM-dependent methyltransferase
MFARFRAALRRPVAALTRPVRRLPPLTVELREIVEQPAPAASRFERIYYAHQGREMFKWAHYLPLYDRALSPFVDKSPTVLEIGLAQGGSLHLWRDYLGAGAKIVGLDLDPSCKRFEVDGFPIYIGDQSDPSLLNRIAEEHGPFDIVIDDGSHISAHQIATFQTLFPRVKYSGVYVCEDLHTSYWKGWGGGFGRTDTFIAYLKALLDKLHDKYHHGADADDPTSEEIDWMTLADSIAFIHKRRPETPHMALVGHKMD